MISLFAQCLLGAINKSRSICRTAWKSQAQRWCSEESRWLDTRFRNATGAMSRLQCSFLWRRSTRTRSTLRLRRLSCSGHSKWSPSTRTMRLKRWSTSAKGLNSIWLRPWLATIRTSWIRSSEWPSMGPLTRESGREPLERHRVSLLLSVVNLNFIRSLVWT